MISETGDILRINSRHNIMCYMGIYEIIAPSSKSRAHIIEVWITYFLYASLDEQRL